MWRMIVVLYGHCVLSACCCVLSSNEGTAMPAGNDRSTAWSDPRIETRPSPISGRGMFARTPIAAGERVAVTGGTVMTNAEFARFQSHGTAYSAIQIDDDLHLIERVDTTTTAEGSFNHACDGNVWMADAVTFVARRAIAADEELTVDHALFTVQPQWRLAPSCQCGAAVCRRTITGNDWQRTAVQARYRGHFSPFINTWIAHLTHES